MHEVNFDNIIMNNDLHKINKSASVQKLLYGDFISLLFFKNTGMQNLRVLPLQWLSESIMHLSMWKLILIPLLLNSFFQVSWMLLYYLKYGTNIVCVRPSTRQINSNSVQVWRVAGGLEYFILEPIIVNETGI
jgi:hypothetical protein